MQASETPRFICVGTHHKTGTIWMRKVFRDIAKVQDIPFMQCYRVQALAKAAPTGPQILVNWSSTFPPAVMDMPDARFIHIIRDPRDVLLSGMRYHRVAPLLNEKFLREERDAWGGKNYQDHLNSLPTDHDRLIFEMENKHHDTVKKMLKWPYGHPHAAEIRYEDLIEDTDCKIFRGILERFGFQGLDIDSAMQSFWDKSLFGGMAKKEERTDRVALHVSSGAKAQWVTKLPREVAGIYVDRYADALKSLGYADNSDWVADCLPAAEIAA